MLFLFRKQIKYSYATWTLNLFFTTGEKLGDCITNAFFPLIMSTFDGKASSLVTYEPALRPDTLSYILCYI